MIKFSKLSIAAAATVAMMAAVTVWSGQPTLAQGPQRGGRPSIGVQSFNACTTTNYGDIVAKALGLTTPTLRKDIVGGQTLQAIAAAASVDLKTVSDAFQTARKTDIDQAVTDGVITQAEATAMEATPAAPGTAPAQGTPRGPNPNRTPGAGGGPRGPQGGFPVAQFPDISTINILLQQMSATQSATQPVPGPGGIGGRGGPGGGFGGGGIGLAIGPGTFNLVKQYEVAALALNMKCTDVVKTLITPPGKSIMMLAADQKVDPQTISAALTKAYKDALAQDVTDGVITQAQSDELAPSVDKAVTTFVNNPLPMGPQPTQQAQ